MLELLTVEGIVKTIMTKVSQFIVIPKLSVSNL